MQKITPFLWFNNNVEEAMNFYVSIFKNSKIISVRRQGKNGPVFTATFQLEGQKFFALNGGPQFKFTEAISFFVECETQKEVDTLWAKLSEGGQIQQCGWLKDKYGLSWQVAPTHMNEMFNENDKNKIARVTQAFLKMKKFNLAELKRAAEG